MKIRISRFVLPLPALVMFLVMTSATLAKNDLEFAAPISFNASSSAANFGDFNNNGAAEFILGNGTSGIELVRWDQSTNTLLRSNISDNSNNDHRDRYAGDLVTADVDGDGFTDVLAPNSDNFGTQGEVFWYRNPGANYANQTWSRKTIQTWNGNAIGNDPNRVQHLSEIEAQDIDGDGDVDVVVRDILSGLYLIRNDGNDQWTRRYIGVNPREGLDLFDPDFDGDLDIAINGLWIETPGSAANPADLETAEFRQHAFDVDDDDGSNQYPTGNSNDETRDYAKKVVTGDFNGDGRIDIAVSNAEQLNSEGDDGGGPKGIRVYLSPEDATAGAVEWKEVILDASEVGLDERFSLHTLQAVDVDRDGDLDLVSGLTNVGRDDPIGGLFALLNNGDGLGYEFEWIYEPYGEDDPYAYNNILADADGDGDFDLFGGSQFQDGEIRFFENLTSVPEPNSIALLLLIGGVLVTRRSRK